MSNHNMFFEETPDIVWFAIAGKDRERYVIQKKHHDFVCAFQEWLWAEKIHPFTCSGSGAGQWHGAFFREDAERVRTWLLKHEAIAEEFIDQRWSNQEQQENNNGL
jgi:hypothetical protein